ncbi:MAG TPA: efflux RND transporter periplasmic adaptor subunit [Bacteroidales bacterium]|nr:efflux RND transporter periplasmic adaptor subunit [Bacteroidales bacterium]
MKNSILFIGALSLLVFFTACKSKQAGPNMADQIKSYPVATLTSQDVELQSVFPVVIKGQEDIDIKPRIDGFIEAVLIDEGTIVKKGQPLFRINSPSAVQSIETAQATYNTAKLDIERMRPLAEKGIISKVRLTAYENTFASAKAALEQAKATVGWTTVTSPVNGVVGAIPFRQGSLVNNTSVLTTVANTTNVIAYFSMNEKDLYEFLRNWEGKNQADKIKNMPSVKLQLSDGSEYEETGRIQTISGVVDAVTGAVNFRAIFPNKQGLLRSGTSGKIIIPRTLKNVLVIPQGATFNQQDKVLVYKVQGDSVVQKSITVKSTPDSKSYAVLEGLEIGDKIVTSGLITLRNGKKIKVQ